MGSQVATGIPVASLAGSSKLREKGRTVNQQKGSPGNEEKMALFLSPPKRIGLSFQQKPIALVTRYKEPTHWVRHWCWARLRAGEKKEAIEDEMGGWQH